MKAFNIFIIIMVICASSVFLMSCTENDLQNKKDSYKVNSEEVELSYTNDLKKFNSKQELIKFIEKQGEQSVNYYGSRGGGFAVEVMMESSMDGIMTKTSSSVESQSNDGGYATDFSETNIQVEGVDEADIVKNDGRFIYTISQNKLLIVDAYPADSAHIVSETEIDGYPYELFIKEDKLILFSRGYDELYSIPEYDFMPRKRNVAMTFVYTYDISDKKNPIIEKEYSVKGDYHTSRMIGDYVYFISKENLYYYNHFIDMPFIRSKNMVIAEPEVFYFDMPYGYSTVFTTVASFKIGDNKDSITAKTFLTGYSDTVYVSENNIYISYQKNIPYDYEDYRKKMFFEAVLPNLNDETKKRINSIDADSSISETEKWSHISEVLEEMYNIMTETKKETLQEEIKKSVEEWEIKREEERRKTVIHKIAIKDGEIDYKTKGEINGHLLNQFSMDEYNSYFRAATTSYIYNRKTGTTMHNNVYVLDEDMKMTGKIEGLAEDERIYSARFMGERLYMVTFKTIDPLFVIDLSSPQNPRVLGELKIPGYSDYLHPYDENHLIGIGKETEENQWGGISTGGVKVALFDVSDVSNPKEIDNYQIGGPGTESEALNDHRAFLFDRNKDITVIPIRIYEGKERWNYDSSMWYGAYVFSINPEEGVNLKGKITHSKGDYDYWNSPYNVRRSLYMDNILYTLSSTIIKMNDMDNDFEEVNMVKLPYKRDYYPIFY